MSKRELIDAIRMHNRTVSPAFLERFGENDLKAYLERVSAGRTAPERPRIGVTIHAKQVLTVT